MYNNINWTPQQTVRAGQKVPVDVLRASMFSTAIKHSAKKTVYRRVAEGYGSLDAIHAFIEEENGRCVIDEMEQLEGPVRLYIFPSEEGNDAFAYVTGYNDSISMSVEGFDQEWIQGLIDKVTENLDVKPPKGCVMMLASDQGSLYLTELGEVDAPIIRKNYTEKIQTQYDNVVSDLRSDSPGGRLTILDGPPGTGKSFMIRAIVTEAEALYIYVPASIGGELTGPGILPVFLRERERNMPIALIMEDADATIATRQIDNVGQLSDLLNMSDGILGEMADLRIIATTNAKTSEIDAAALRTGRVNEHIRFENLSNEHALSIFYRLTDIHDVEHEGPRAIRDVVTKNTLASVYSLARSHGWKPEPTRKKRGHVGTSLRSLHHHSMIGDL